MRDMKGRLRLTLLPGPGILIVVRPAQRVATPKMKLARNASEDAVKHLQWLRGEIGA